MDNMAASDIDVMETSMMSQSSTLSSPMSMREKSQLKRRITKEHNSNFRAGYVPVNEPYLHKAGLRGRKSFLLYALFLFLLVVAALNLALTAWLMWIFRISHRGFEPMEFVHSSAGRLLRFLDSARFDSLVLKGTFLGSRYNKSLEFSGIDSEFILSTSDSKNESMGDNKNKSMVEIRRDLLRFTLDDLELTSCAGKKYFSLSKLRIPEIKNLKNLHADVVETREVKTAPDYDYLSVESWAQIHITGDTGITATSNKETNMEAKQLIVKSLNGSTVLDGAVGMYISQVIPRVMPTASINPRTNNAKICVCGSNGRVFVVPVTRPGMGCANADEKRNPCLI